MHPTDVQRGEFLALAHQHHDTAGTGIAHTALGEHKRLAGRPSVDLLGDLVSHGAVMPREPAFLACFTHLACLVRLIRIGACFTAYRRPQRHQTRPLLPFVPGRLTVEPQGLPAYRLD